MVAAAGSSGTTGAAETAGATTTSGTALGCTGAASGSNTTPCGSNASEIADSGDRGRSATNGSARETGADCEDEVRVAGAASGLSGAEAATAGGATLTTGAGGAAWCARDNTGPSATATDDGVGCTTPLTASGANGAAAAA